MKKLRYGALLLGLFSGVAVSAQNITIEKIYSGAYYPKSPKEIFSLKDGQHFLVQEESGLVEYAYADNQKIKTFLAGDFDGFSLSSDEQKALVYASSMPIYRHSFTAVYKVIDVATGKETLIFDGKPVQEATFSPNAEKVAFIFENNLYIQNLSDGMVTKVTEDGKKNHILNGLADWVYEEEFGHARQYEWSADSKHLVFVKSDESEVKEVDIPMYGKNLYPEHLIFKYPKAGEKNSVVSLHSYDIDKKELKNISLSGFKNYYIPQIYRGHSGDEMMVITSERTQNAVDVLSVKAATAQIKKLFTETDAAWIDTDNFTLEFLPNGNFLWASERDGFRHLYLYNKEGKLLKPVTKGTWEITKYYGYSPKQNKIFLQTTQNGSTERAITSVELKSGKTETLSKGKGTFSADFSADFTWYIENYKTTQEPGVYTVKNISGKTVMTLEDNSGLKKRLETDGYAKKEFIQIPNASRQMLNAWMMKPADFNPSQKYPVLMYQYSGPGSQEVDNNYDPINSLWFSMLTQKGYIVLCVDGRGTGYRGRDFKKVTYKNLGKYEIEDQISAAKWLGKQPYINAERIGIFGWSFGGYMASLAMTKGEGVFKTAIAVAPVTNWRYYDTIYTERFLGTPQENPEGYDQNSPTEFAKDFQGNFLLIHGTADDNVHYQNSMEFSEALIQNNKQFRFMSYPDKNHGIYGGYTRIQLYHLMTDFLLEKL